MNVDHDAVLWAGDLNVDFFRNTRHSNLVRHFVDELDLVHSWDNHDVDFTHYNELNNTTHVSTIDHFFWDTGLDSYVQNCGVIHHPDNSCLNRNRVAK